MSKKQLYYVYMKDTHSKIKRYIEDKAGAVFAPAHRRNMCYKFDKKRAEQIVSRLKAQSPSFSRLEYGIELVGTYGEVK